MNEDLRIEVPFLVGMMRLHEREALHDPNALADWIEARLDQGLTWFDHADIYGDRKGETLFGDALRARPGLAARVRIVTKACIVTPSRDTSPYGVKHYDSSPDYLSAAIDASLTRLGVERLDHFLLHRPDPLMDAAATGGALDAAIDAGKIGAVGVSNFLPEQWRRLQASMRHPLVSHQLQLSLAHPEPLFDGLYDALLADGMRPMAWSPLGGGTVFEDVLGESLARLAQDFTTSSAGLALAWLRGLPGHPVPVIGTLREQRIDELLSGACIRLDRPTWFALLEEARSQRVA
ncbi:aryl-alcohol dehydrogenase [Litchfieldella qijiaojingensis]|uniref:Aryl-alcohol dehydrogenase n=1 Tax=Litchfieldella qijiaojingensis TaxID=980347 RepID=A0ABQ2YK35_9GAMM|nr:aldo/keto reductase [Halomonas qijiaojingensis]GGX86872.1 aryl-alcohol dehydrogenase [Halomonas qijiaojingensis]